MKESLVDKARWFYWTHFRRDYLMLAVARRLPRWLVYWSAIRLGAHATTGRYGSQIVPELYFTDALQRWDDR